MKQVLIIDASPMFREFLTEKLTEENVKVETASLKRDAFTKLLNDIPDLVILDIEESLDGIMEFLSQKISNKNTAAIPMILSGPKIDTKTVASLKRFGVVKYFFKPIKFDVFFEAIGRRLNLAFSMDTTPCVLETHLNRNIIFIEIAMGMNREKMALLKYKLTELMDNNRLDSPKVIIMMSDLELNFVDGANLELLLDNVIADKRIEKKNIFILSMSDFTKELIEGHPEYHGIEVVTNLSTVLNSIVEAGTTENLQDLISDQILSQTGNTETGSVEMRFFSDTGVQDDEEESDQDTVTSPKINVAVVDDDAVIRQLLSATYQKIGANCDVFASGSEFLQAANSKRYNLVILDIYMPGISGFNILKLLHDKHYPASVIVYSQMVSRDYIIQATSLGAKSYIAKPQKPEAIVQKSIEILNGKI